MKKGRRENFPHGESIACKGPGAGSSLVSRKSCKTEGEMVSEEAGGRDRLSGQKVWAVFRALESSRGV